MKSVFVIEGNYVESRGILDKIKKSLADYEYFSFDEKDSFSYVSQMIKEISCFGMKRLYVIYALPKIDDPKDKEENNSLEENDDSEEDSEGTSKKTSADRTKVLNNFKKLFGSIPKRNVVVFYNVGISAESFFNEVNKVGKVYEFEKKIDKNKAKERIFSYFSKRKIEVLDSVSSFIVDALSPEGTEINVDNLNMLLKKAYQYVYGRESLSEKDVYSVFSSTKEFIVWSLYKKLDSKDICSSLSILYDYLSRVKYFQIEVSLILYGMLWRYGLLLSIKSGSDINRSGDSIKKILESIDKLEMQGKSYRIKMHTKRKKDKEHTRVPEYSYKMMKFMFDGSYGQSELKRYTSDELRLIYAMLAKSIIKIRSGCTDSEVMVLLNLLFMTICGNFEEKDHNMVYSIIENKTMLYGVDCGRCL